MVEMYRVLKTNGFNVVFDTKKTDWIYKKGNSYHQLQDIQDIGLIDYYYDEDIFDKTEEEQSVILKNNLLAMGFELEYEEGVDKLRTLYNKEFKFSKNQNGKYEYLTKF